MLIRVVIRAAIRAVNRALIKGFHRVPGLRVRLHRFLYHRVLYHRVLCHRVLCHRVVSPPLAALPTSIAGPAIAATCRAKRPPFGPLFRPIRNWPSESHSHNRGGLRLGPVPRVPVLPCVLPARAGPSGPVIVVPAAPVEARITFLAAPLAVAVLCPDVHNSALGVRCRAKRRHRVLMVVVATAVVAVMLAAAIRPVVRAVHVRRKERASTPLRPHRCVRK